MLKIYLLFKTKSNTENNAKLSVYKMSTFRLFPFIKVLTSQVSL